LLKTGSVVTKIDSEKRINICLRHLQLAVKVKGERRAVIEHRKFYSGYLKGLYNASQARQALMAVTDYSSVQDILFKYLEQIKDYEIAV
jgi:tRNA-dihydrouridine synthase B